MACTKNTAKKYTSGSAPYVLLKIAVAELAQYKKALANTKGTVGDSDIENRTVYHNGMCLFFLFYFLTYILFFHSHSFASFAGMVQSTLRRILSSHVLCIPESSTDSS